MARKSYQVIGLGGTFDHFHAGHAEFIDCAAKLADKLLIGVTTPSLSLGKAFPESIESLEQRQRSVINYCRQQHYHCQVFPLKDIFGPTLEKSPVQALAVTPETEKGADLINQARQKLKMRPLPVYICDYFLAEDGQPLHAENIRAGKFNRQGQLYSQLFTSDLKLSHSQRSFFKSPLGTIRLQPTTTGPVICVVGDTCLENFIAHNWPYHLGVFDNLRQREQYDSPVLAKLTAETANNPAATITADLVEKLQATLKAPTKPQHLRVEGEEDLAAVALFLLLPFSSLVYYGQPNEGMVEVVVTEELKEQVKQVLSS